MALVARSIASVAAAAIVGGCDGIYAWTQSSYEPQVSADSDACTASSACVVGEVCSFGRCAPPPPPVAPGTPFFFGAFGDCLPSPYAQDPPTPIVTANFRQLALRQTQFVAMTGDYLYVQPPDHLAALQQLESFRQARELFLGPVYYALGNHDADPENLRAYREVMSREVYYAFTLNVGPPPGSSTVGAAKFVFVADNAWSADQAAWLEKVLATPSDYTFVFRHHSSDTALNPQALDIIGRHPLTLLVVGHVHVYQRIADREVITGNGGAPVYNGPWGYLTIQQRPDGRVDVTSFDESVNAPVDAFTLDP